DGSTRPDFLGEAIIFRLTSAALSKTATEPNSPLGTAPVPEARLHELVSAREQLVVVIDELPPTFDDIREEALAAHDAGQQTTNRVRPGRLDVWEFVLLATVETAVRLRPCLMTNDAILHRPPRLALGLNPESRRDEELRGGANDVLGSHVEIPHHFLKRDREDSVLSRKPKRYAVEKRRDARSVSGQPSEVILRRTVKSMKLVG